MKHRRRSHVPAVTAFTLVELLVVIGIIALLISILLPALNRARQQAYLVDCASRMRQMGQAVHIYAAQNKQYLPASVFNYTETTWGEFMMPATLSRVLGWQEPPVAGVYNNNRIFRDVDARERVQPYLNQNALNHYNWNAGVFPDMAGLPNQWASPARPFRPIPVTQVDNSSELVAAWDGTNQNAGWGGNAFRNSMGLAGNDGGWIWWATQGMSRQNPNGYNVDQPLGNYPNQEGHVDYRHVNMSTANVLFLDGHVESKKKGELKVKDFLFNRGQW